MKYVVSDLHGSFNEFKALLKKIDFSENDELFILGDIFDRGRGTFKILDVIRANKNITLLKGNHEQLFIDAIETDDVTLWYWNGGNLSHEEFLKKSKEEQKQIYEYISDLPLVKVVDKFILVHAGLYLPEVLEEVTLDELLKMQNQDTNLWDRSSIGFERRFKDYTVICGHTPVQSIKQSNEDVKILHAEGVIYIDCGCCFKHVNGVLGCLRLDDMKEFYIKEDECNG